MSQALFRTLQQEGTQADFSDCVFIWSKLFFFPKAKRKCDNVAFLLICQTFPSTTLPRIVSILSLTRVGSEKKVFLVWLISKLLTGMQSHTL